jgi:hypothetical protein
MEISQDFKEWLACLIDTKTEFVVVGGYALAHHGCPRFTGDIDILVHATPENAARVVEALGRFGFASLGLQASDFAAEGRVVQLGFPPQRIDILTRIDGVEWSRAASEPSYGDVGNLRVPFISRDALIANKKATGRLKDLADVEALEGRAGRRPNA